MKRVGILMLVGLVVLALLAAMFYWRNLRGIWPALPGSPRPITDIVPREGESLPTAGSNDTRLPLQVPAGFSISVWADNVPGARVLARDGFGNYWVSQTNQGIVSTVVVEDGSVSEQHAVFRNLSNPHGLAVDPERGLMLYIAEEDKISRVPLYSDSSPEKIADLPSGGGHYTRTIAFGPDGRLYVANGSSCNVCEEDDPRRSKIYSMKEDGSDIREEASGLRNTVFFAWHPTTQKMWGTDMGRDLLGDELPPDEINIFDRGPATEHQPNDYGWPYCYGKKVHDTAFDSSEAAAARCVQSIPSHIDLPAHSAPLGLAFVPKTGWPAEYADDLIIAYHGSWNRSEPTGYKLTRVKLSATGVFEEFEDFISGWLQNGEALGRPVDVRIENDGVMYVTDDKAGVIYKVTYAAT